MLNESRCGILCSSCPHRAQVNCAGCTQIQRPFWGDQCPVKSCCERKQLNHCGQCSTFPCALLTQFAYDPEQGDQGARIAQCQQWQTE